MTLSKKDILLILAVFVALGCACIGGWMAYANAGLKQQVKELKSQNRDYQEGIDRIKIAETKTEAQAQKFETAYAGDTLRLTAIRYSFDSLAHVIALLKIKNYAQVQHIIALGDAATDSLYAINKRKYNP